MSSASGAPAAIGFSALIVELADALCQVDTRWEILETTALQPQFCANPKDLRWNLLLLIAKKALLRHSTPENSRCGTDIRVSKPVAESFVIFWATTI